MKREKSKRQRSRAPTGSYFSAVRPNDILVHCGHENSEEYYLVEATGGLDFARGDGTMGTAQWAICCSDCFHNSKGNIHLIEYALDFVYGGMEAPVKR